MSRHRRCVRPRHHVWQYVSTLTGWTLARCTMCGHTDLA